MRQSGRLTFAAIVFLLATNHVEAQQRAQAAAPMIRLDAAPTRGIVPMGTSATLIAGSTMITVAADGRIVSSRDLGGDVQRFIKAGRGSAAFYRPTTAPGEGDRLFGGIVKLGADGSVEWARRIVGANREFDMREVMAPFKEIAASPDGSIFYATTVDAAILVMRISPSGSLLWQREIDTSGNDGLSGVMATRDGGLLVMGNIEDRTTLARFDAKGALIWESTLAAPGAFAGFVSGIELSNGDYVLSGSRLANGQGDVTYARFSTKGALVWQKTVGGGKREFAASMALISGTPDNFAMLGPTQSFSTSSLAWLLVADGSGNLRKQMVVGPADFNMTSTSVASDGGAIWVSFSNAAQTTVARLDADVACGGIQPTKAVAADSKLAVVRSDRVLKDADFHLVEDSISAKPRTLVAEVIACTGGAVATTATQPALSPQAPSQPEVDEYESFSRAVGRDLAARRYRALDELAERIARVRATFRPGSSARKSSAFYGAFQVTSTAMRELGEAVALERFNEWRRTTRSVASQTALANFHYTRAWQARGSGYSSSITRKGGEEFEREIAAATKLMDELEAKNACDASCLTLIIAARNLGGWSPQLRKVLATDPTYWNAFMQAATYLLPQWGGSIEEIEKFADEAGDVAGDAVYTKIIQATTNAALDQKENPRVDWPRMRRGFEAIIRDHPKSDGDLRAFAYFAWKANDRATARRLFDDAHLEWNRDADLRIKRWALEPQSTQAVATTATASIARTKLVFPDHVEYPIVSFISSGGRTLGITATRDNLSTPPTQWTYEGTGQPVTSTIEFAETTMHGAHWIAFEVSGQPSLKPFDTHVAPVEARDNISLLTCAEATGPCAATRVKLTVVPSKDASGFGARLAAQDKYSASIGAPVLSENGAVLGVVDGVATGDDGATTLSVLAVRWIGGTLFPIKNVPINTK